MEHLTENIHWYWLAAGVILMVAEMIAPGAFLLWLGIAAFLTGVLVLVFDPSLDYQVLFFSIVAIASTFGYWFWRRRQPEPEPSGADGARLNELGNEYVGRVLTLATPIVDGRGRVKAADTSWRCTGPDLPAGARVKVVAVQSGTFEIEAIDG